MLHRFKRRLDLQITCDSPIESLLHIGQHGCYDCHIAMLPLLESSA